MYSCTHLNTHTHTPHIHTNRIEENRIVSERAEGELERSITPRVTIFPKSSLIVNPDNQTTIWRRYINDELRDPESQETPFVQYSTMKGSLGHLSKRKSCTLQFWLSKVSRSHYNPSAKPMWWHCSFIPVAEIEYSNKMQITGENVCFHLTIPGYSPPE